MSTDQRGNVGHHRSNAIYHLLEVATFSTVRAQFSSRSARTARWRSPWTHPKILLWRRRLIVSSFYFAKLIVRNAFAFHLVQTDDSRDVGTGCASSAGRSPTLTIHETPPYPTTASELQMLVNGAPSGIYSGATERIYQLRDPLGCTYFR